MPISRDLVDHGVVQTGIFATAATTQSLWGPLLAALVGAFATWALQQISRGLWRQIALLERRIFDLEALRCPYGEAARARCKEASAPISPTDVAP